MEPRAANRISEAAISEFHYYLRKLSNGAKCRRLVCAELSQRIYAGHFTYNGVNAVEHLNVPIYRNSSFHV